MNVLLAGGTGFIGGALARHLTTRGHRVSLLSRRPSGADARAYHWDPEREELDPLSLEGIDAVVNLAGENLAGGRWNAKRKRRLVESRVLSTRFLVRRMGERLPPVRALVNASAVGIYGNRGEEILTEESVPGAGFLAELCRSWEEAAVSAREAGVRVSLRRFGVVIGANGGVLEKLTPVFKLGIGGRLGSGRQWMSWIALADVLGVIEMALTREDLGGPVNAVAPAPVRNSEFTRVLARVLRRPAVFPAPAVALRIVLGEMADEALLSSARAEPARLLALGYHFAFPDLEGAFRGALRA
ncbi:MAG TPA: TIGR01777 family oxidoreductase [Candidatus Limnocylindrales bacterium]|nr:TIGR01777 family oxidoreductase [Candidatus Limnocylindrales bacterium]